MKYINKRILRRPLYELHKRWLKIKYGNAAPQPFKLIWIDPDQIEYMMPKFAHKKTFSTFVIDGDWDQTEKIEQIHDIHTSTEQYWLYKATKEFIVDGIEWRRTTGIQQKIQESNITPDRIKEEKETIESLCEQMQKSGYKTQQSLNENVIDDTGHGLYGMPPEYDEVRVNIGRDGQIFHDNGKHRFCVAKVLNITSIPVRVRLRHNTWQRVRNEIANATTVEQLPQQVSQYLGHPDIKDINSHLENHELYQ